MSFALRTGTILGSYRIVAPLGAGGMGEVYRAHDAKLDRPVALKILPSDVVQDSERVRRFVQEARSASSLSHPNIVHIYDIGEAVPQEDGRPLADGIAPLHYIAMELVEGSTLRLLLGDRSLEPRTLLAYLAQAAEGLAKAHAAGIIHRDLKPENIMVTRDGFAKVLDFGLAKLTETETSGSALAVAPTEVQEDGTREGVILGTIGYMSPEQAMGRPVDHRTDLFAFGCLLYETATGRKPFTGESNVDVLHAIVREKPTPVEEIAPALPSALARTIRRCLAKEPDRRYQSMKDLALELHEMVDEWDTLATPSGNVISSSATSQAAPDARRGLGRAARISLALGVTAIAVATAVLWYRHRTTGAVEDAGFQAMRISAATASGTVETAALSPDGRYLAYSRKDAGSSSLWLRQLATGSDVQLVAPQGGRALRNPAFVPDGSYIDYTLSDEQRNYSTLYRIPFLGGRPSKVIFDIDSTVAYSPDGRSLAFVRNHSEGGQSLVVAAADGSGERVLATRKRAAGLGYFSDIAGLGPTWSPSGALIAAPGWDNRGEYRAEIVLVDVNDGTEERLGQGVWYDLSGMAWLPDGSGLVVSGVPKGRPFLPQLWLVDYPAGELSRITNDSSRYLGVSLSADGGHLLSTQYLAQSTLWKRSLSELSDQRQLTHASREVVDSLAAAGDDTLFFHFRRDEWAGVARLGVGDPEPVPLTRPDTASNDPAVSRDGRVVVARSLLPDGHVALVAMDRDGNNARPLPPRGTTFPFSLAPSGSFVVVRDERGLWRQPLTGGEATLWVEGPMLAPIGFSPDGERFACLAARNQDDGLVQPTIRILRTSDGALISEISKPAGPIDRPRWAPDGRAFTARVQEGDGYNIVRLPLDGSAPTRLTNFEGLQLWDYVFSTDGATLYYTRGETTADAVLIENFR